jgi:hypothetical protein
MRCRFGICAACSEHTAANALSSRITPKTSAAILVQPGQSQKYSDIVSSRPSKSARTDRFQLQLAESLSDRQNSAVMAAMDNAETRPNKERSTITGCYSDSEWGANTIT